MLKKPRKNKAPAPFGGRGQAKKYFCSEREQGLRVVRHHLRFIARDDLERIEKTRTVSKGQKGAPRGRTCHLCRRFYVQDGGQQQDQPGCIDEASADGWQVARSQMRRCPHQRMCEEKVPDCQGQ